MLIILALKDTWLSSGSRDGIVPALDVDLADLCPVRRRRSVAMARQSHRCAGCGLKVSPALAKKFRWCEYLGRYFCTGCHGNQQFYIPARIIHKHDYNM